LLPFAVAANPNWAVAGIAAAAFAVGLAALIWAAPRTKSQPGRAGAALLLGIVLAPLSIAALVWAMDLSDRLGV
jgi:hypothetical protein